MILTPGWLPPPPIQNDFSTAATARPPGWNPPLRVPTPVPLTQQLPGWAGYLSWLQGMQQQPRVSLPTAQTTPLSWTSSPYDFAGPFAFNYGTMGGPNPPSTFPMQPPAMTGPYSYSSGYAKMQNQPPTKGPPTA
jgi:hypothetical protein